MGTGKPAAKRQRAARPDNQPPEALDPAVRVETRRGARGVRYVYLVAGSTVEHRSYGAALAHVLKEIPQCY